MTTQKKRMELLAPGGDADAVKAAIIAGADAVYCGLARFNARKRAENLTPERLTELVHLAHHHSCRIYLTLNSLVVDDELDEVIAIIDECRRCGVDACIVQDWGILYLLREHFPEVEVHASTQMTTHNCGQIGFLSRFGIRQVNFARELSLGELRECAGCADRYGITPEVFVHGAFCISFSGQCYMSSAMSGRSGNRGACVQPCRRNYRVAGSNRDVAPFNLKDNSAFSRVKELAEAGTGSVKIEGRIKGYKYVYTTVTAWRKQIDRYYGNGTISNDDPALHSVFNRSLTSGYLDDRIDRSMFIDSSRDRSLVRVATIRSYTADTGVLKLDREVSIDDEVPVLIYAAGFTFVCTGFLGEQCGRFSYRYRITHKLKGKIKPGDELYRQGDYSGPADLKARIEAMVVPKRLLRAVVSGQVGTPLRIRFIVDRKEVEVRSEQLLVPAQKKALTSTVITEKLGMLGTTPFKLGDVDCSALGPNLFLPISALNELRRSAVAQLEESPAGITSPQVIPAVRRRVAASDSHGSTTGTLAVLVDNEEDLAMAHEASAKVVFALPVDAGGRSDYVISLFKRYPHMVPWFPAILIGEHFTGAVALLDRIGPTMIVTDNSGIGGAAAEREIPWVAGPLLNCTNSYALEALCRYGGCSGAFISHELSREQMRTVTAPDGCSRWYTMYAPLLLMNTRQCIIRNCTDCATERVTAACIASCEKTVELTDGKRQPFYIVKKHGQYNQVYNGRHYCNPAVIDDMPGDDRVFLVDIRAIPSRSELRCSKAEFVAAAAAEVNDGIRSLKSLTATTTAGQYVRGI